MHAGFKPDDVQGKDMPKLTQDMPTLTQDMPTLTQDMPTLTCLH